MPSQRKLFEALRWTISRAASEFGLSPKTVATRVKLAGVTPGEDRRFTTVQIYEAISGHSRASLASEKLRKLRAENATLEWRAKEREGIFVSIDDMEVRLRPMVVAVRQRILGSTMTDDEKDEVLTDLGVMLENALTRSQPNENVENTTTTQTAQ